MALMVVHHKVRDHAMWRPAFNAHESSRVGAGKVEAPNDFIILANVSDVDKPHAWTSKM